MTTRPRTTVRPKKAPAKKLPAKRTPTKNVRATKRLEDQITETSLIPLVDETVHRKFSVKLLIVGLVTFLIVFGLYKLGSSVKNAIENSTSVEQVQNRRTTIKSFTDNTVVLQVGRSTQTRKDGSFSWRINNPGLIFYGDFAKENGAIGEIGKYAVFDSYQTGRKALETLLFVSDRGYKTRSLESAMRLYAPANQGFNTDFYISTLRKNTGVPFTKVLSTFTDVEKNRLLDALEQIERFKPGTVDDR